MGVKKMTGSAWDWCDAGVSVTQVTVVGWGEPGSIPGDSHQIWRRDHSFVGWWRRKQRPRLRESISVAWALSLRCELTDCTTSSLKPQLESTRV